jgi:hypothetical protein
MMMFFWVAMMQTVRFSEALASTYESTRRQNPEGHRHHPQRGETLKSDTADIYEEEKLRTVRLPDVLKINTVCFSETLVSTYESTRRQIPEEQ